MFTPTELALVIIGLFIVVMLCMGLAWTAGLNANTANWQRKTDEAIRSWVKANKKLTHSCELLKQELHVQGNDLQRVIKCKNQYRDQVVLLQTELNKLKGSNKATHKHTVSPVVRGAEETIQEVIAKRRMKPVAIRTRSQASALVDPVDPRHPMHQAIQVNHYHHDSDVAISAPASRSYSDSSSSSSSDSSSSSCSGGGVGCD